MRIRHKNSGEIIELDEPNFGKHFNSIYGYLVSNCNNTHFIYSVDDELFVEDVSDDYEILNTVNNLKKQTHNMNEGQLTKLFVEFAGWLEMHGADKLTEGVEPYAQEFARQKIELFDLPDINNDMEMVTENLKDNIRWTKNFIDSNRSIITEQELEKKIKKIEQFKKAVKIIENYGK